MLKSLYIQNFAIVDEALVSFEQGFNVITGETGVGKSLLIDALNVALGERAYKDLIRQGSNSAIVEAIFEFENLHPLIVEKGISGPAITLKREIKAQGSSRVWINGQTASVQELKFLGDILVDLHGQHEHQYLLNEEHHITFLDDYADVGALQLELSILYKDLSYLESRLRNLEADQSRREEQRQLYAFQLQELQEVDPKPGELQELESELRLLENAQQISELADELYTQASGEQGAAASIQRLNQILEDLGQYTREAGEFLPELAAARVSLQSVADFAQAFLQQAQADPQKLHSTRQRLTLLNRLCLKYNRDYPELLEYIESIKAQLGNDQPVELERRELETQIKSARKAYSEAAQALSEKRSREAQSLTAAILEKLKRLGIPRVRFEIQIETHEDGRGAAEIDGRRFRGDATGIDTVAFWMQANPGEPLRPLARIASGGEISRVMLALKSSLSGRDRVATVIFDEIDAGISGKIARVVGRELKALGHHHQLICITHLPQIASLADTHYRVQKMSLEGRTVTRVNRLSEEERQNEVAMLLGDGEVSEAILTSARELITDIHGEQKEAL